MRPAPILKLSASTVTPSRPRERRTRTRRPADVFFNKFLDGHPYLCRTLDVSEGGMLVETFAEPEVDQSRFAVELSTQDGRDRLWLWARCAWRRGRFQALEFISMSPAAQNHLKRWLEVAG